MFCVLCLGFVLLFGVVMLCLFCCVACVVVVFGWFDLVVFVWWYVAFVL